MKRFALITIALLPFQSHALQGRPLLLAAGVAPQAYQQYLAKNPQVISLVDYLSKQPSDNSEKVYALADRLDESIDQLFSEIENLQRDQTLTEEERHFLRDLLEKASSRALTSSQRAVLNRLTCVNDGLLGEENSLVQNKSANTCKVERTSLSSLQKLFPWADAIKWEHRLLGLSGHGQLLTIAETSYHFQILSNTHQTVNFYGTMAQLKQQNFQPTPWVSGVCDQFNTVVDDFSLHETGLVFFNESCVQPLKNPEQTSSAKKWMRENKNWLYIGGALVLGAVAYGLKDKTLVIDRSAFK